MKKSIIVSFIVLALSAVGVSAQMKIAFGLESPEFALAPVSTDKYQTLDTCYLTVSYTFRSKSGERDDSLTRENLMELQMGNAYNAFFNRDLRDLDISNTKEMKEKMVFSFIPSGYIGWDILKDNKANKETITNRLPFSEQVIEYEEIVPELTFRPTEETDSVMGYFCKSAVCDYGGRSWKVYYTEEIPLPYGPWKLNGADGLILKALDTENNFVFEAVGMTQQQQPVIRYSWNRKSMDKDEWARFEEDMYRNAGVFVRGSGAIVLIMDDSEKGSHRLKEDWSEYYNPLERK